MQGGPPALTDLTCSGKRSGARMATRRRGGPPRRTLAVQRPSWRQAALRAAAKAYARPAPGLARGSLFETAV